MDNQGNQKQSCRSSSIENSTNSQPHDHHHQEVSSDEGVTRLIEGDTYPISDTESTIDSVYIIDTNTVKLLHDDEELNQSMSQDSLIDGEHDDQNRHHPNSNNKNDRPSSTNTRMSSKMSTMKSSSNGIRSVALDEHIKLVKQKKEEAEVLRLQRFQEQLRKKEQKWQQQQLERVKKWLQLRNRDTDHRSQVEVRRKKREEEAKAKIDELIRREKEREQNYQHRVTHHLRTNPSQKPDSLMSMSTDILSTRRAISASRLRSNPPDLPHRRGLNQSPAPTTSVRDDTGNSAVAGTSNGDAQIRTQSVNRPNLQETIRRLAKPRPNPMTQSIQIGTTTSTSHGLPVSRSSYQLRVPTPPVNSPPTTTASNIRRHLPSRPATVPTSANESRTSPSDESARSDHHASSLRQASANITRSKVSSTTSKPPTSSTRSKSSAPRSIMTTSHSSSSLSSTAHKSNVRRIPTAKPKPITSIITPESQPISDDHQQQEEEQLPVNENTPDEQEVVPELSDTTTPVATTSKREQQMLDEQDYQRKLNQKIREAQQRLEIERQREEERQRQLELEEHEREQEQIRLVEQQTRAEQERLQRAIEERDRENESKRQEEQRLQQQREDIERRQAEEAERLQRERQERAKKEDEERNARKKRLDLIMRRTRQISPNSKENNSNTTMTDQTNGHDQTSTLDSTYSPAGTMKSSMSENHFPSSSSTDNFLLHHEPVPSPITTTPIDTPKFKSPLIQSLLNKARNTRSTDNLTQSSMTASQIMTESMIDESTIGSATRADLSEDDDDEIIASSINGHTDLHLSSSNNMNSYHDRPMETAAAFQ